MKVTNIDTFSIIEQCLKHGLTRDRRQFCQFEKIDYLCILSVRGKLNQTFK